MNRQHPYGGYDAGPNDRGNRPGYDSVQGYPSENASGGYYPAGAPPPPQQQQQQQSQRYAPPSMNISQNEYQGGPNRGYAESNPYPASYSGGSSAPPGVMNGSRPAITLGPGPLNSQSQYGAPLRYDGGAPPQGVQSPALSMNSYGSSSARPPTPQHYTAETQSRNLPAPMRQGYDSHLPQKPDSGYPTMPPRSNLSSPPAHLPRPPGRDWSGDDPSRKRARRDGSNADEGKESDDIIRERLKRERPCRTLFVRNIEFNADVDDLRRRFEAFGEIKSYFDLTSKRGLLFISYYDLRSAERAKASMQEFVVNGRKVDVHYSLPRESDMTKRCDRDKDQGTLFILLKKAQGELNDDEVRATFAQFGEIKSLRRYKDQGNCRFLEYYDCRACKAAHDAMFGATWNGGTWDMKYAWDAAAPERIAEPSKGMQYQQPPRNQGYGSEYGSSQSPVPGGAPGWGGQAPRPYAPPQQQGPLAGVAPAYPPYSGAAGGVQNYNPTPPNPIQGTKRPYDYDDQTSSEPPMRRWGQAQGAAPTPYGQARPPMDAGYGAPSSARPAFQPQNIGGEYGRYGGAEQNGYGQQQATNQYGGAPPIGGAGGYTQQGNGMPPQQRPPPPMQQQQQQQQQQQSPSTAGAPPASSNDDRLEQAQKVQQLLASLKPGNLGGNNAASTAAPTTPATSTAAPSAPAPSLPFNIAALLQMAQANAAKK